MSMRLGRLAAVGIVLALVCAGYTSGAPRSTKKSKSRSARPAAKTTDEDAPKSDDERANPNAHPADKKVYKTPAEWRKQLTPEQYRVTRKHETEKAFKNAFWNSKKQGTYHCVCCDLPLYSSDTKFDSGTGWPSFWAAVDNRSVETALDTEAGEPRTEIHCARCGAHLGHVFGDGPLPTGNRHCLNSASLKFVEKKKDDKSSKDSKGAKN
ncbi:MAG TPA: peptide-methionine (R)-S-oxide reductase MsrB [Planctomycetaceae bacterium]|nr:peptide-methionine (R)-S-oxide reductase MsrB [Planctomycetaceae bacterium]